MKILKVKGYYINKNQYDDIKTILNNSVLKNNYSLSEAFITKRYFEFHNFKNQKDYFLKLAKEIIKTLNLEKFILTVEYEENDIIFKQIIDHNTNNLSFYERRADKGLFCPYCFSEVDYKEMLKDYDCPFCDKKVSECLEVSHSDTYLENYSYGVVSFTGHNEFKFPILRWIHESINNNPEKTIICPDCGKEYKLKDIHNSILMSPQIIEKYNEDVLKN